MSAEISRKIQATLFLASLTSAQVPSLDGSMQSSTWGSQGRPAMVSSAQAAVEKSRIQQEDRFNTGQSWISGYGQQTKATVRASEDNALKSDPLFQDQAYRVMEHIEALLVDQKLQEEVKRLSEHSSDAHLQDQAKNIVGQMEFLMGSPEFQKKVERIAKRIDVMIADRNSQEQVKFAGVQFQTISTCTACPKFLEHAKDVVEQVLVMMLHPTLQERAKHGVERMNAMSADTLVEGLVGRLFDRASKAPRRSLLRSK